MQRLSRNPILTRSGLERLIEWRHTVVRDAAGTVIGTLSSGTDLTDRKRAEEAQRTSEQRYRTLFECAPDGIVVADRESRYIDVNASMCRMLGYSRDEMIGLHAPDVVTETEFRHIAPALRTITTTSDYHREWRFKRKDGSVFSADVISTVMPDGNLLGMVRDVTERNATIAALRTNEQRMRFALQSANIGIWDMDHTTGVLRWSEILEAHHGLRPGTFAGTFDAFMDHIHPDDRASTLETVSAAMKSGSDFTIENRTIWPDGTVHWLCSAGRTVLGEHGQPLWAVGISQDVTDRKRAEATLVQSEMRKAAILDSVLDCISPWTCTGM